MAEQPAQLRNVDDREQVGGLAVGPLERVDHRVDQMAAILEKPVEIRRELLERFDPLELEALDREQRDQTDQRADPELLRAAVGVAQHVVEEPVLAIEQLHVAAAHVLHRVCAAYYKTLRSVAPSSTWAASYLHPFSAAFITTIAESSLHTPGTGGRICKAEGGADRYRTAP